MSQEGFYRICVPRTFEDVCFKLAAELKLDLTPVDQGYFLMNPDLEGLSAETEAYRNAIREEDDAVNEIFRAHGESELPSRVG